MAWSWSHTAEGIWDARENFLRRCEDDDYLIEVATEWWAHDEEQRGEAPYIDDQRSRKSPYDRKCDELRAEFQRLPGIQESIAEDLWDRISQYATCDNGGFHAWVCPYGCHTVPFSPEHEEEEE